MALHMLRLCVGCDTIEDLLAYHQDTREPWLLHTRMSPKRADELLDGGSLYRIFKGMILCRQQILGVRTVGEHPNARCEITLDPEIIRVAPTPRRAFQGWRYFDPKDVPPDLDTSADGEIPMELARQLREAGAW
ncbi:DUF1489 domain-containing protein [Phenylobacterium sp. 20VBR1]|uniref:DUF1489 domain-containing protein n=1 Tax=Phenylobacterium glaciei TaxID=2803784 RepID=A0A941D3R3_9CAUL|nr:DUF1489 family protein [Phenylobacterium glaciei]MBR7619673.1 DUF1489 domain-containing protein [Phenylobacterium glaciei]